MIITYLLRILAIKFTMRLFNAKFINKILIDLAFAIFIKETKAAETTVRSRKAQFKYEFVSAFPPSWSSAGPAGFNEIS